VILPADHPKRRKSLPLPPNDPAVEAIAERLRAVMARQPTSLLNELADVLGLDRAHLRRLIEEPHHTIDVAFLIDTVAAVVHTFAVDPQWLLTGHYDGSVHRQALLLGEDRSPKGVHALREYVVEQYRRLRDSTLAFISGPRSHELTTFDQ
jgi:hypothetical protein